MTVICIRCLFIHYLMFFSCSYNIPLLICCSSLSADQPKTPDKQNSASVCHLLSFFTKLIWCSSFNMFTYVTFIIWFSVLVHMMLICCSFLSADQQKKSDPQNSASDYHLSCFSKLIWYVHMFDMFIHLVHLFDRDLFLHTMLILQIQESSLNV